MKAKFSIFTFLLWFPFFISAQNIEAGLSVGLMNYQGDLVEGVIEMSETNLAYGAVARFILTEKISVRANIFGGRVSGNDNNFSSPARQARGIRFKTDFYEFSVMGEWNFLNEDRTTNRGDVLRQKFTPYIYGGIGAIIYTPDVFQNNVQDPEGTDYSTSSVSFPAGAGLKIGLSDRIVLSGEFGGRPTLTDYLDGVSKLGGAGANDWYWMGNFVITYTFGSPSYF